MVDFPNIQTSVTEALTAIVANAQSQFLWMVRTSLDDSSQTGRNNDHGATIVAFYLDDPCRDLLSLRRSTERAY